MGQYGFLQNSATPWRNHGASPQVIRQKGLTTNLGWQRISISGEMGGWFTRSMESSFFPWDLMGVCNEWNMGDINGMEWYQWIRGFSRCHSIVSIARSMSIIRPSTISGSDMEWVAIWIYKQWGWVMPVRRRRGINACIKKQVLGYGNSCFLSKGHR